MAGRRRRRFLWQAGHIAALDRTILHERQAKLTVVVAARHRLRRAWTPQTPRADGGLPTQPPPPPAAVQTQQLQMPIDWITASQAGRRSTPSSRPRRRLGSDHAHIKRQDTHQIQHRSNYHFMTNKGLFNAHACAVIHLRPHLHQSAARCSVARLSIHLDSSIVAFNRHRTSLYLTHRHVRIKVNLLAN